MGPVMYPESHPVYAFGFDVESVLGPATPSISIGRALRSDCPQCSTFKGHKD